MKSVIGVISLYDEKKESYWMLPGYIKSLEKCGAIPLILPLTTDKDEIDYFIKICDGFLLTGGHDVNPALYGEVVNEKCGEICSDRDEMEGLILDLAVKNDKSVLGICRGIQFMNVFYGGTLYQDLESEFNTNLEHHMNPPYDIPIHDVKIIDNTPLARIIKKEVYSVNSYHHQGIKDLSPKFKVSAIATDGLIEGIYMPDKKFILGIQWHPEFAYLVDESSLRLIQAFVESCCRK